MKLREVFEWSSSRTFYLLLLVVAAIYLLFPGNNLFSEDSIAYANSVKYGEELFWPHHLLYCAFNYCLFVPVQHLIPDLDAFRFMQLTNAACSLLCLLLFRRLFIALTGNTGKANVWTLFIAGCFGVIRFSVEIETYIIPIFFSLLSSLFYLYSLRTEKKRYILYCSLAASMACLFHQIHLFWGIGLFVGFALTGKWKSILLYALSTLSVLAAYSLVLVFYEGRDFSVSHLITYLLDYYYSDDAEVSFGLTNIMLAGISFVRTFFQIHGIIPDILRLMPVLWLLPPLVLFLLGLGLYRLKGIRINAFRLKDSLFEFTHLVIFVLQFAFALFSHGNAEFMAMLPFLIPLFLPAFFRFNMQAVSSISMGMLIWNFCFSVYPNHHFDYFNNRHLLQIIDKHPDKAFILMQRNIIVEQHYYRTGKYEDDRLIHADREKDIRRLQSENRIFYTDVLTKKMPFNRARFIHDEGYKNLQFVKHIASIEADLATYYVDEVCVLTMLEGE